MRKAKEGQREREILYRYIHTCVMISIIRPEARAETYDPSLQK